MAEIHEFIETYQNITNTEERPEFNTKDLIFDNLRLLIHYDVIYYGIIYSSSFGEDKAQRLLNDIKSEVTIMYK